MSATKEVSGYLSIGDRFELGANRFARVTKVVRRQKWAQQDIDDNDDFWRTPGWYSIVEYEEVPPTEAELARLEAERAWIEAEQALVAAELEKKERAFVRAAQGRAFVKDLIENRGFAPQRSSWFSSTECRKCVAVRGVAPGVDSYECDGVTVAYLVCDWALGDTTDGVTQFLLAPSLQAQDTAVWRVQQKWENARTDVSDRSYPGPGVPYGELTSNEASLVASFDQRQVKAATAAVLKKLAFYIRLFHGEHALAGRQCVLVVTDEDALTAWVAVMARAERRRDGGATGPLPPVAIPGIAIRISEGSPTPSGNHPSGLLVYRDTWGDAIVAVV